MSLNDFKRWFFLTISLQEKNSGFRNSWIFLLEEFGIQDFLLAQSGILDFENWNSEFSSRIRKPTTDWTPESTSQWQRIRNPVPWIQNPRFGIQNPGLSWIPFHRTKDFCSLSPPVSSSISDLTNSHKIVHWSARLVVVEWNQIIFQELRIRIFLHWLFPYRCTFRSI